MSATDDPLNWSEPDAGCVTCGSRYVTIADHRCGECLGRELRHCPHCLGDIAAIVERELVRRLRRTSHDVNDAWVEAGMYARFRLRERIAQARAGRRSAA